MSNTLKAHWHVCDHMSINLNSMKLSFFINILLFSISINQQPIMATAGLVYISNLFNISNGNYLKEDCQLKNCLVFNIACFSLINV